MSRETSQWLNTMQLIGMTAKRGNAWHYRASDQGSEPNHYDGPIPVEDVRRRLFYWKPVTTALRARAEVLTEDGVTLLDIVDNTRQVIIHPDTEQVLGVFRAGYKIHDYDEWLIRNVETVMDASVSDSESGLIIAGAGLLKGGAVGWVQFEQTDTREVAGVQFRPFITSFTSLDGSLATGYTSDAQVVVCDNTLCANISSATASGMIAKRRHTKNSLDDVQSIRDALNIEIASVGDSFARQVEILTNTMVSDGEWSAFVQAHVPIAEDANSKARTRAENKRSAITGLWNADERVAPWHGTAFGVVQAVNTFTHHLNTVRSTNGQAANRAAVNALRMVTGGADELDRGTIDTLNKVFAEKRRKQISFV